jgi:hypothetical protein
MKYKMGHAELVSAPHMPGVNHACGLSKWDPEINSLLSGENNFGGQLIIKKARNIPGLYHVNIFELPHLNIQHEQKYFFYRTAGIESAIKFNRFGLSKNIGPVR